MIALRYRCWVLSVLGLIGLVGATHATESGNSGAAMPDEMTREIVDSARDYLRDYLRREQPELSSVELELASRVPAQFVRSNGVVVLPSIRGWLLSKRMCVWITLQGADKAMGTVPIWFSVKAYQRVFVATRARAPRQPLRLDEMTLEERDIAPLSSAPLSSHADIGALRARHALSTNHVLLQNEVEALPPVVRGEDVTVQVRYGSVEIKTNAVALHDGMLGEAVRVQSPTSTSTFTAQVVGHKTVLVTER